MITNANSGALRRAYDYIAVLAVLHVLAAIGGGLYLLSSGAITPEKLQAAAAVFREEPKDDLVAEAEEAALEEKQDESADTGPITPERMAEQGELLRLEAERIKAELDQRLTLNNSIMLRVTTQRDEFKKDQEQAEENTRQSLEKQQGEGFRKQIAIFEALSPKVAVEHLLNLEAPEDAARVLLEMDTRKAKKIVESAKSGIQLQRMQVILQKLRDAAPDRSVEIEGSAE